MSKQNVFMCMNPERIAQLIDGAMSRVVYINSGVNEKIASALILKSRSIDAKNISVITDFSETVCRFGYGTALGFSHLCDGNIDIKRVENLRIGCLLIDNSGWVFSPTPLLLEADKVVDSQPNAIQVLPEQILVLLDSAAPTLMTDEENDEIDYVTDSPPVKIITEDVLKNDIDTLTEKLEKNPPQKFDVSRRVNVFNTLIEFVELSLTGCSIGKQTVKLPAKLLVGGVDKKIQKQLRTGYSVIANNSDLSGKHLNDHVNDVRNSLTKSIHHFGRVALKSKRNNLEKELDGIRKKITVFQNDLKDKLESELSEQKKVLVDALCPAIMENPPPDLKGQIEESKPNQGQAAKYLGLELTHIFPSPDELIKDMKLECVFKGVTYETLQDELFQERVQESYPLIEWNEMFGEFDAVRGDDN